MNEIGGRLTYLKFTGGDQMRDQVDFGTFLEALSEFRRQDVVARPTAHTSSVSTRDWKRVEEALASKAERS